MYERILAAIDESDIAERVLTAAQELAVLAGGEVWVLHAHEREPAKFGVMERESRESAQTVVDAAVEKLAAAEVTAHGSVAETLYGYAAREIINAAKANDVGIIVMGSRGWGDLAGLLLGSTAHKVIHLADRPVVVVR
ncbi:MAG TPA: universal stress protein [Streptosporangiaceae bacterium]|nr:universal stress protein [Streptosporangiaceae bacterium]